MQNELVESEYKSTYNVQPSLSLFESREKNPDFLKKLYIKKLRNTYVDLVLFDSKVGKLRG